MTQSNITIHVVKTEPKRFYIRLSKHGKVYNYDYDRAGNKVIITLPTIEGCEIPVKTVQFDGKPFATVDFFLQWVLNSEE